MGGYSSGRVGWRAKCEYLHAIDVRRWAREDYLTDSGYFGWQWTRDGERTGSIGVWVRDHHVELDYSKDGESIRCPISFAWTRCHLGGQRIWFLCPNLRCQRRVAKLYLGNRYFACRRCYNLAYQSQSDDAMDRLWRKQRKLETKLDDDGGKPKGMHWRTYHALRERIMNLEIAKDEVFAMRAMFLMRRWV